MDRKATCLGCHKTFSTKSPHAKWCSATCRARTKAAGHRATKAEPEDLDGHPLVVSAREELESAGRLNTFSGELAMQLARKLAGSGDSGVSSLSKELRTVMAAAMDGVAVPPPPPVGGSSEEEDDPVERARREREIAREAAATA